MALDPLVFPVVGHRVEIEIEGRAGEEFVMRNRAVPGRQQTGGLGMIEARGILREVALLGDRVEPAEQRQARVGDQRHHMALPFDRPQLERQRRAQCVLGRDHRRSGQPGRAGQMLDPQAYQIGHEQEQPAAAGGELRSRYQREGPQVGHRLHRGCQSRRPLFVEAPGQRRETLGAQELAHGGRAQRHLAFLEQLGDLVHRVVLLA